MKKVILLGYQKRVGKDTVANMLLEKLPNSEILHFADPLKEIIATTFNISIERLEELKESNEEVFNGLTMRQILQRFGTEAMKPVFEEEVWVDLTQRQILESKASYIIIPDLRFKVEATHLTWGEFNKAMGLDVVTLKISRNIEGQSDTHISENELSDYKFDLELTNDGFLEELKYKVNNWLVPKLKE